MSRSHQRLDPEVCFSRQNIISHTLLFRMMVLLFSRGNREHIVRPITCILNPKSSLNDCQMRHPFIMSCHLTSSVCSCGLRLWLIARGMGVMEVAKPVSEILFHSALHCVCEGFTLITLIRHSFTWDMGRSWLQHPFIYLHLMKRHRAAPPYNGM